MLSLASNHYLGQYWAQCKSVYISKFSDCNKNNEWCRVKIILLHCHTTVQNIKFSNLQLEIFLLLFCFLKNFIKLAANSVSLIVLHFAKFVFCKVIIYPCIWRNSCYIHFTNRIAKLNVTFVFFTRCDNLAYCFVVFGNLVIKLGLILMVCAVRNKIRYRQGRLMRLQAAVRGWKCRHEYRPRYVLLVLTFGNKTRLLGWSNINNNLQIVDSHFTFGSIFIQCIMDFNLWPKLWSFQSSVNLLWRQVNYS